MTNIDSPSPPREVPIGSIQPGGGLCFSLELWWSRCRRGLLRRFFPGHVRRFAALKRGDCPNCPHDILDPRDLKPYRNVCGFHFSRDDDPYAWRGRVGLARWGLAEIVCFSLLLLPLMAGSVGLGVWLDPLWLIPLAVLLPVWLFILSFFRDPERTIPSAEDALISPADGVITHLEEVAEADFPGGRAFRVSIFLSVFNVHVNRMPRAAIVRRVRYIPGEFLDARDKDCAVRNEQLWLELEDVRLGIPLRVKQVAGAVARRIVCEAKEGETFAAGQRYGMIKFGSRTDVLLPVDRVAEVVARVGQAVRGGADLLLRLQAAKPPS